MDVKHCSHCKAIKPLDEFSPHPKGPHGRDSWCRACRRVDALARSRRNAKIIAQRSKIRRSGPEYRVKRREQYRAWAAANRDRIRLKARLYRQNPEQKAKAIERARTWYYANRERAKESRKAYYRADPKPFFDRVLLRKTRLLGIAGNEKISREAIAERDQWTCYLCGERIVSWREFSLDHVIPVIRGGPTAYWNLKATHRFCNTSKGIRPAAQVHRRS
jgi:hypothetical protein